VIVGGRKDIVMRGAPPGAGRPGGSPLGRTLALVLVLLLVSVLTAFGAGCGEEEVQGEGGIGDQLASAKNGEDAPTPASFISLCANCHDRLDPGPEDTTADWRLERKLVFDHPAHFAQGIRCQACHQEFPHKPGYTEHVAVETCFTCHGSVHGQQGMMAPTECEACHTPDIEPVTPEHDARDWVLAKGEPLARHSEEVHTSPKRQLYCKMCHEATFCSDCHRMDIPHPAEWTGGHAETAMAERQACIMCHETQSTCDNCHHQSFPELADWGGDHRKAAFEGGAEACYTCHEPPYCSSCHVRTGKERGIHGG
jgi:hypothetical protein